MNDPTITVAERRAALEAYIGWRDGTDRRTAPPQLDICRVAVFPEPVRGVGCDPEEGECYCGGDLESVLYECDGNELFVGVLDEFQIIDTLEEFEDSPCWIETGDPDDDWTNDEVIEALNDEARAKLVKMSQNARKSRR